MAQEGGGGGGGMAQPWGVAWSETTPMAVEVGRRSLRGEGEGGGWAGLVVV